jgi:hypothetical protein
MRIRSIKPEFWRSDDIAALSIADRLLFIGLWSYVDDSGVGVDRLALICADLFAADLERDPPEVYGRVTGGLRELSRRGLITRYEVDGKLYLHIATWDKHQRIEKPSRARYPLPISENAILRESSWNAPVTLPEDGVPGTGEQGNRGTGEQGEQPPTSSGGARTRAAARAARATRLPDDFEPTPEMLAWARTEAPNAGRRDHEQFVDYWRAKSGKDATKVDWVAAWRKWMRTESDRGGTRPTPAQSRPNSAENRMLKAREVAGRLAAKHAQQPALTAGLADVVDLPTFGSVS